MGAPTRGRGFAARRTAFRLSSIHAAHEFLARQAASGTLRLVATGLGEPSHHAPLLFSFLHPAGAAAPVQHVRNVTQHVQHLHLLQQFIHRLTLRVEQHEHPPRAARPRVPARMTVLRERLVETMRSTRDGTIRRDIERLIRDRFAGRDVKRVIQDRRAQWDIERLMRIHLARQSSERLMQIRFDKQNTVRLMQLRSGKQNTERLMQLRFGKQITERLMQLRFDKQTNERLTQLRFGKQNTERLMQLRFDKQTTERLMQLRFGKQNTERLTQLRFAKPNLASVTPNYFAHRAFERLTRDRFTRLDFERLAHVRRTARDFQRLLSDRSPTLRVATVRLQTVVAPLVTDTSTTVLQRYGTASPLLPTLALKHAPRAQPGEIRREIERIERTVQTKVVREILHQGHQQQHIRTAVSDALLSPKLVQALARQIHTTLEQRANVERYRKGVR